MSSSFLLILGLLAYLYFLKESVVRRVFMRELKCIFPNVSKVEGVILQYV